VSPAFWLYWAASSRPPIFFGSVSRHVERALRSGTGNNPDIACDRVSLAAVREVRIMIKTVLVGLAISCAASRAYGQMSAPPIISALPDISSISPSNTAGLLQYCISKELVSSASGGAVLDGLAKKRDLTNSRDFTAGASGQILGDKNFSIGSAPGFLQSQACDLVLKRAKNSL
jgi:hypothetical protein